jgi:hypothetical protein
MGEESFFFGVAVEAGHGAQSSSNRGSGPASVFQLSSEGLDIGSPYEEQVELMVVAPDQELAQVEFVGVAG